ncbi:MAG TPA: TIGR03118 family protein, partial [Gammaproteobacteria bacterium]|nr:TIGR03118 family protein [Gammaproteobacteria bacterium]
GTATDGSTAMGPARFIFVTEGGQILGWAPNVNTGTAFLAVDNSAGGGTGHAIYKGAALSGDGTSHLLYAADFHNGRIDVFDGNFQAVALAAGAFADPSLPPGFAPFGIQAINGDIYVTYAMQDQNAEDDVAGTGLGFVDVFDPKGTLVKRLIQGGVLNAPWGLALAPASFGPFGSALLVGNFGDGSINAFSPITGELLGTLSDASGMPIRIEGLWAIQFGNGLLGQETNALFASAGPADEQHGTYSVIKAQ